MKKLLFLALMIGCSTKPSTPDAGTAVVVAPRKPPAPIDPNHAKMVAQMQAPYHAKFKGVPTPGPVGGSTNLQKAYNTGAVIDIAGPGEGSGPVTIQAHSTTNSQNLFQILDHDGNTLMNVFDSSLIANGTIFLKRLFLFGGDEIVSSGGFAPNDGDLMTYDAGASKWYGQPLTLPNVGPGAGTYCGAGSFVTSTQLDAQGRVIAVNCSTPTAGPSYLTPLKVTEDVCTHVLAGCTLDADWGCDHTDPCSSSAANTNMPVKRVLPIVPTVASHITGVKFYWHGAHNDTITCEFYDGWFNHYTLSQSGSIAATTAGEYTCSVTSTALKAGSTYLIAAYGTTYDVGAEVHAVTAPFQGAYCQAGGTAVDPKYGSPYWYTWGWAHHVNSITPGTITPLNANGNGTCRISPLEPVLTVP